MTWVFQRNAFICHVFSASLYFSLKWYLFLDSLDIRVHKWISPWIDGIWGDSGLVSLLEDLQYFATAAASERLLSDASPVVLKSVAISLWGQGHIPTCSIHEFNCPQVSMAHFVALAGFVQSQLQSWHTRNSYDISLTWRNRGMTAMLIWVLLYPFPQSYSFFGCNFYFKKIIKEKYKQEIKIFGRSKFE